MPCAPTASSAPSTSFRSSTPRRAPIGCGPSITKSSARSTTSSAPTGSGSCTWPSCSTTSRSFPPRSSATSTCRRPTASGRHKSGSRSTRTACSTSRTARGLAIEINTRFLYRDHPDDRKKKYLDANARLARKARVRGVGIAIGSDAHSPKDQGNGFDVILKLLDDAKINELVFPVAGRLARVALRATREHLEAQAQARRQPSAPGSSITGYSRAELGLPEEVEAATRREARASRAVGAKKRPSDATRVSKRPAAGPPGATSRRTAESKSSAGKAKAAHVAKAAAAPKKSAKPPAPPAKKKPAPPAKAKKAPAKSAATAARKAAPGRATAKKAPARKSPPAKAPPRKAPAKKPAKKKAPSHAARKPKPPKAGYAKKIVKKKKTAAKRR